MHHARLSSKIRSGYKETQPPFLACDSMSPIDSFANTTALTPAPPNDLTNRSDMIPAKSAAYPDPRRPLRHLDGRRDGTAWERSAVDR
jgi:hypothetical protein